MIDPKLVKEFGLQNYIDELRAYDHGFLNREGALYFSRPFGFEARTYREKASPDQFKGLTLVDGQTEAEGIAADELAMQICDHLAVKFQRKLGRGAQLAACCDALTAFIN